MVLAILTQLGCAPPIKTFYCGDDEDALLPSPITAALYIELHKSIGWHLQDIKQIVGYQYHEYLRYMLYNFNTPIHPLSSMLAVLVTGNWYTADATWMCSQMQALTSQLWIILQRGARHEYVERLAVTLFNRMFTVKLPSGKSLKLEWYDNRPNKDSHRLWQIEGTDAEVQETVAELPKANKKNIISRN
jgi:hypothetical protein